jgi:hypothetical protein
MILSWLIYTAASPSLYVCGYFVHRCIEIIVHAFLDIVQRDKQEKGVRLIFAREPAQGVGAA